MENRHYKSIQLQQPLKIIQIYENVLLNERLIKLFIFKISHFAIFLTFIEETHI